MWVNLRLMTGHRRPRICISDDLPTLIARIHSLQTRSPELQNEIATVTADTTLPALGDRRHDLDALRACAMLLGIGLHVSLSFFQAPWPIQDTQQSPVFGLFLAVVHGFRMPLFFIISGFFTMMVYRKRGMAALLKQRAMRILLPLVIGMVTIIPLQTVVAIWAISSAAEPENGKPSLASAIRQRDLPTIDNLSQDPEQINRRDGKFGVTPLAWAALSTDVELVERLIERGAAVDVTNLDGNTPLHAAAFLGRDQVVDLLLKKGANPNLCNQRGELPLSSVDADWNTTEFIVKLIGVPVPERADVEAGRLRVKEMLSPVTTGNAQPTAVAAGQNRSLRSAYKGWIQSDRFRIQFPGGSIHLMTTDILGHLWFLWFLTWLIGMFAIAVGVGGLIPRTVTASENSSWRWRHLVLSNLRYFWLIPLTLLPQWFMGEGEIYFGPDTSTGILPQPHVLVYYGLFFAFGALYFEADDTDFRVGRQWWLLLPLALLIAFPVWVVTIGNHSAGAVIQALYVWIMSFGMMGLFRTVLKREYPSIRYLSDASYWFYLAHLPLVMAMQAVVRPWQIGAIPKFLLINLVVTAVLLVSYQFLVRHTIVGVLLNGRRKVMTKLIPAVVEGR